MQRGQQALAGQLVQGQAAGAFRQMLLHLLVALGELLHQAGGGIEVSDHLALVGIETFLQIIQLALGPARGRVRHQAGDQETDADTGKQGEGW
ncbi:hypothetical protein D9M73_292240 [compost metagenome]